MPTPLSPELGTNLACDWGGFDVGEIPPPSGDVSSLSAHSGPWYIETQELRVEYVRMARGEVMNDPSGMNLSSTLQSIYNTMQYRITSTHLYAHVVARCKARKVTGRMYSTSSYQQPQKFEFFPSIYDPYGNTYGPVSSASHSVLGPMGSIDTVQKAYSRIPWDDALGHVAYDESTDAYSFMINMFEASGNPWYNWDVSYWWGREMDYMNNMNAGCHQMGFNQGHYDHSYREQNAPQQSRWLNGLNGPYGPPLTTEDYMDKFNFLDEIGHMLGGSAYSGLTYNLWNSALYWNGISGSGGIFLAPGIRYDETWHDYSA